MGSGGAASRPQSKQTALGGFGFTREKTAMALGGGWRTRETAREREDDARRRELQGVDHGRAMPTDGDARRRRGVRASRRRAGRGGRGSGVGGGPTSTTRETSGESTRPESRDPRRASRAGRRGRRRRRRPRDRRARSRDPRRAGDAPKPSIRGKRRRRRRVGEGGTRGGAYRRAHHARLFVPRRAHPVRLGQTRRRSRGETSTTRRETETNAPEPDVEGGGSAPARATGASAYAAASVAEALVADVVPDGRPPTATVPGRRADPRVDDSDPLGPALHEGDVAANRELERVFRKDDFSRMRVVGQFNLGFILAALGDDLFIVDQHRPTRFTTSSVCSARRRSTANRSWRPRR